MTDSSRRTIVDGIEFGRVFQFPRLLRSVTAAMQPPRLVVALLIVVLLAAPGHLWDASRPARVHPLGLLETAATTAEQAHFQSMLEEAAARYAVDPDALERDADAGRDARDVIAAIDEGYLAQRRQLAADAATPTRLEAADAAFLATREEILRLAPRGAYEATAAQIGDALHGIIGGVVSLRPDEIYRGITVLIVDTPVALWQRERAFALVFGLLALVVVSLGGTALCRMAACDIAGGERIRVWDAFDFALGNWIRILLTPLLPLVLVGLAALVIVLFGLLLSPFLEAVGGFAYGLALLMGLLLAFLLIGYAVGFPMLLPAVACENCDAADALQRGYAYALNRPLHLLGYVVTALVGLALGYVVVALFVATALNLTADLAGTFFGGAAIDGAGGFRVFDLDPPSHVDVMSTWHSRWAGACIGFWEALLVRLVAAYVVSYLFTSATMIYLQMRRVCDGQDVEEIWRPGMTPGTHVPLPVEEDG